MFINLRRVTLTLVRKLPTLRVALIFLSIFFFISALTFSFFILLKHHTRPPNKERITEGATHNHPHCRFIVQRNRGKYSLKGVGYFPGGCPGCSKSFKQRRAVRKRAPKRRNSCFDRSRSTSRCRDKDDASSCQPAPPCRPNSAITNKKKGVGEKEEKGERQKGEREDTCVTAKNRERPPECGKRKW